MMKALHTLLLVVLIGLLPAAVAAQQKGIKKSQVVGSWTLAALDATVEGKKTEPFGPTPKGHMSLDPGGTFSIQLYRPGTSKFAGNNRMKGTDAEYKAVGLNSIAYYGTYKLNEKEGVLDMRIEQSTFPNFDGADQKRMLKLVGKDLQVSNPATAAGGTAVLLWKRAK